MRRLSDAELGSLISWGMTPNVGGVPKSLAQRPKAQREWLGLSRKNLATLLGIDPSNVDGWETEKHRPTKKSLALIDKFLVSNDPLKGSE